MVALELAYLRETQEQHLVQMIAHSYLFFVTVCWAGMGRVHVVEKDLKVVSGRVVVETIEDDNDVVALVVATEPDGLDSV
jgi:hypothetical protein